MSESPSCHDDNVLRLPLPPREEGGQLEPDPSGILDEKAKWANVFLFMFPPHEICQALLKDFSARVTFEWEDQIIAFCGYWRFRLDSAEKAGNKFIPIGEFMVDCCRLETLLFALENQGKIRWLMQGQGKMRAAFDTIMKGLQTNGSKSEPDESGLSPCSFTQRVRSAGSNPKPQALPPDNVIPFYSPQKA